MCHQFNPIHLVSLGTEAPSLSLEHQTDIPNIPTKVTEICFNTLNSLATKFGKEAPFTISFLTCQAHAS